MQIKFIKIQADHGIINISFDNGKTWKEYDVPNVTSLDSIEFSKKDCDDLDNIIVGYTAQNRPAYTDARKKYFDLETKDTIYTTPETLKDDLSKLSSNTASKPYSIRIQSVSESNYSLIKTAIQAYPRYVDISSTDFYGCSNVFNKSYIFGEGYQKYLTAITIPDDLKSIGSNVFRGCSNLKSIEIPGTVSDIGSRAFKDCTKLSDVTFNIGISQIDALAFDGCTKLTGVTYLGSLAKWKTVSVDDTNTLLTNTDNVTTISYTTTVEALETTLKGISSNSLEEPAPLNITDISSSNISTVNSIIKSTKKYIDLSSTDLSACKDLFTTLTDSESSSLFDIETRQYLTGILIPDNVTELGKYVFSNYSNLSNVMLSDNLKVIGQGAFMNCTSLAEIEIPSTIESIKRHAFFGCDSIKLTCNYDKANFSNYFGESSLTKAMLYRVKFPESTTTIEDDEFKDCTGLASVTLPDNLTSLGKAAFSGCTSLRSIIIPSNLNNISENAFSKCSSLRTVIVKNDNLTSIGDYAFYNCTNLETITWSSIGTDNVIHENVTYIGKYAFAEDISISEPMEIKGSIGSLNDSVFEDCTSLTGLTVQDSVTNIGNKALMNCGKISNFTLPSETTTIGDYALYGTGITTLNLTSKIISIGTGAFKAAKIKSLAIPSTMTNIGNEAFMDCDELETVSFPDELQFIGCRAFANCKSLDNVVLPSNLYELGYQAFSGCSGITNIGIPQTLGNQMLVTRIEDNALSCLDKISCVDIPDSIVAYGHNNIYGVGVEKTRLFVIPTDLTKIATSTFIKFSDIKKLVIPSNITRLEYNALDGCTSLEEVTIPKSVKEIDFYAFNSCTSLRKVNYEGTQEEWEAFAIGWCGPYYKYDDAGNIIRDGNDEPVVDDDITKDYIMDGNDNLFGENVTMTYNASITDFTLSSNDVNNYTREKPYGLVTYMADDSTSCLSIKSYEGTANQVTFDKIIYRFGKWAFENCYEDIYVKFTYTPLLKDIYLTDTGLSLNTLSEVNIPEGIVELPKSIFRDFTGLTKVTIPSTLTTINQYAFCGCTGLKDITVPDTVTRIKSYAFKDCYGLKAVAISEEMDTVEKGTFENCTSLVDLKLTEKTKYIKEDAFKGCTSLTYLTLYDALEEIGSNAFAGDVSLKITCYYNDAYNHIDENGDEKSFYFDGTGLYTWMVYKLTVSGTMTEIMDYQFTNEIGAYDGLTIIYLPSTLKRIGKEAFYKCANLEEVYFSEGLEEIDEYAFSGCVKLKNIGIHDESDTDYPYKMPSTIKFIGDFAFEDNKMEVMYLPNGIQSFFAYETTYETELPLGTVPVEGQSYTGTIDDAGTTVTGVYRGAEVFNEDTSVFTDLVVTEYKESIGKYVFSNCDLLYKVHLPEYINHLGEGWFFFCTSLSDINTPVGLEYIEKNVFFKNLTLQKFFIEDTVKSVGSDAFTKCYNCKLTACYNPYFDGFVKNSAFPESIIYHLYITGGMTEIPDYRFEQFTGLKEVTFNDTYKEGTTEAAPMTASKITRIGYGAFKGCKSLTTISMPSYLTELWDWAFADCISLESIVIPSKIEVIRAYTFENNESLKKVTFKSSKNLTKIERSAFLKCKSLTGISVPDTVSDFGSYAFGDCTTLASFNFPTSSKRVADKLFCGCRNLSSITLTSGTLTEIGNGSFEECDSLKSISIPDTVTEIGNGCFTGSGLTSITLPSKVVEIGSSAFSNCSKLSSIIIQGAITRIGFNTFENCTSLKSFNIPSTVTNVEGGAFNGCENLTISSSSSKFTVLWSGKGLMTNDGLTFLESIDYISGSLTIPETVIKIGNNAFYHNNIKSITIPNGVKYIDEEAFLDCDNLASIDIPNSIVRIGQRAFMGCDKLTSVSYTGSESDWNEVFIGLDNNDSLLESKMSYSA